MVFSLTSLPYRRFAGKRYNGRVRIYDHTGERFGRLTVIARAEMRTGHAMWLCKCDCGNEKAVRGNALTSGATRSCGCIHREMMVARNTGQPVAPFSLHRPPEGPKPRAAVAGAGSRKASAYKSGGKTSAYKSTYQTWWKMVARCTRPGDPVWARYGGRGIAVCDRWLDFGNFLADMGARPEGLTLERKDNDGGYEPANCIWADRRVQARNRRGVKLTPEVLQQILALRAVGVATAEIARRVDISYKTVTLTIWIADTFRALQETPPAHS
jgi:hypothetical protein